MVVIGLGKNLLLKSVLGHCALAKTSGLKLGRKKRDKITFGIKLNKTENEPIIVALPAFTFLQLESF